MGSAGRAAGRDAAAVTGLECRIYRVPTDQPEADGTLAWSDTTVVTVEVQAAGEAGLGWTYAPAACRSIIEETLRPVVVGSDVFGAPGTNAEMVRRCRNFGRPGIVASAISAVDIALWDLKARLVGLALADLFGRCRAAVPVYGSGGFTTYDDETTAAQLEHWTGELGIPRVKLKVGESWGTNVERDLRRVALARKCIGDDAELYVDANGGYARKQAVRMGVVFSESARVSWFEEPVSSDDLVGLREVRDHVPCDVAAGEYGYDEAYFARMVSASAVDCLQIDVTRCGGYTSWLRVAGLASATGLQVSGHCAPNLHLPVAMAVPNLRHVEYFHDHERTDPLLFDGCQSVVSGELRGGTDVLGHGMTLKDVEALRVVRPVLRGLEPRAVDARFDELFFDQIGARPVALARRDSGRTKCPPKAERIGSRRRPELLAGQLVRNVSFGTKRKEKVYRAPAPLTEPCEDRRRAGHRRRPARSRRCARRRLHHVLKYDVDRPSQPD